jgi:putative flippase GtrA
MALAVPLSVRAVVRVLGLSPRFLKFGAVGSIGVGLNLGLLFVLAAWAHIF